MKLPRDLSGKDLGKKLERVGYDVSRQVGSHIRFTTKVPFTQSITVPNHDPLKVGTLSQILKEVAKHKGMSVEQLLAILFA